MHAESIAWVSGRTDLLAAVFVLGSFYLLLRSTRPWHTALGVTAFALALLAKETAVMFALFYLLWALVRRKGWLIPATLLVLAAGFFALRAGVLGSSFRLTPGVSAGQFPALMLSTLGLYVKLFFFPFAHQPYHPFRPDFLSANAYGLLAVLFAVAVFLLLQSRPVAPTGSVRGPTDSPSGRFGLWWALLFLLPVLNLLFLSGPIAAERFLCVPSFGFAWLVVALGQRLSARRRRLAQASVAVSLLISVTMGVGLLNTIPTRRSDLSPGRENGQGHAGLPDGTQQPWSRAQEPGAD